MVGGRCGSSQLSSSSCTGFRSGPVTARVTLWIAGERLKGLSDQHRGECSIWAAGRGWIPKRQNRLRLQWLDSRPRVADVPPP